MLAVWRGAHGRLPILGGTARQTQSPMISSLCRLILCFHSKSTHIADIVWAGKQETVSEYRGHPISFTRRQYLFKDLVSSGMSGNKRLAIAVTIRCSICQKVAWLQEDCPMSDPKLSQALKRVEPTIGILFPGAIRWVQLDCIEIDSVFERFKN